MYTAYRTDCVTSKRIHGKSRPLAFRQSSTPPRKGAEGAEVHYCVHEPLLPQKKTLIEESKLISANFQT